QQPDTTKPAATDTTPRPTSVDPELEALKQAKSPKEYNLAGIKFSGTKYLDESLLLSISGLNVGDKVVYPGGDNFSHAILNLWKQRLFSNVQIYFTRLEGRDLYVEIVVSERPRLSSFSFKGIKKG